MKRGRPDPAPFPSLAGVAISDLRRVPHFAPVVADRVWRAWWKENGVPLEELRARLDESLGADPVPTTPVAYRGAGFLGNVALIACDVEERPALSPWVAALWVEPEHRRTGIGAALAQAAADLAFRLGHERVHLAARPARTGFYRRRGWTPVESGVDGLDILSRTQPPGR